MRAERARRLSELSDVLDALIAAAIAVGRSDQDGDRTFVERCRLNVLALAVPDADWLTVPNA